MSRIWNVIDTDTDDMPKGFTLTLKSADHAAITCSAILDGSDQTVVLDFVHAKHRHFGIAEAARFLAATADYIGESEAGSVDGLELVIHDDTQIDDGHVVIQGDDAAVWLVGAFSLGDDDDIQNHYPRGMRWGLPALYTKQEIDMLAAQLVAFGEIDGWYFDRDLHAGTFVYRRRDSDAEIYCTPDWDTDGTLEISVSVDSDPTGGETAPFDTDQRTAARFLELVTPYLKRNLPATFDATELQRIPVMTVDECRACRACAACGGAL